MATPKKKSSYGWKTGQLAGYTYRSAKSPQGRVAGVHPGTTRNNTTVTISPAPGFRFGEGSITRHITKVHHISKLSKSATTPVSKKRAKK